MPAGAEHLEQLRALFSTIEETLIEETEQFRERKSQPAERVKQ